MTRRRTASLPDIEVVAGEEIPASAQASARAKTAALVHYASEPILRARIRLSQSHDPAVARPVIAQGNLDINGRPLRVQVAASTAHEAVELLESRMRRRLDRMARHWEARRGRMPAAASHEWRHISEPTALPFLFFAEPASGRGRLLYRRYDGHYGLVRPAA